MKRAPMAGAVGAFHISFHLRMTNLSYFGQICHYLDKFVTKKSLSIKGKRKKP